MSIEQEIQQLIERALKDIGITDIPAIAIENSREKNYGDYFFVTWIISREIKKHPVALAEELAEKIEEKIGNHKYIKKVEAVAGFINFYLSKDFFIESIKEILKNKNFGKNQNLKNQKVIIEYTDPNPFKEFHIGHLMSNSIGESLSRILEFQGAKIKRANYQGDVGLHVAKAVYGKMQNKDFDWGKAYAFGAKVYENEVVKKEIEDLNKKIYDRSDKKINKLYDEGKKECLEEFKKNYKKLGTKFDFSFFESKAVIVGGKIVEENLGEVFEKGENGAIIFKGEKFGLHTRVFINSEGIPTYEAKELGLAKVKYGKYKYDKSIIITGNEVNDYFKVILTAMEEIFPDLASKTFHIGHGMMRLAEGKMSSRTGKVVTFDFLLNEVEKLVEEKIKSRNLSGKEKKEIAEKVAIGALKYSILKQSTGSDIVYNFEKSISFEGNSGPYLQYSFARTNSILNKAKKEKIKPSFKNIPNETSNLEKLMYRFEEIVEKAGKEYEPHFIVLYLTELAREFNNYYAKNKIVDKSDTFSPYRIALTQAFMIIMKNGLWLLGISAPAIM